MNSTSNKVCVTDSWKQRQDRVLSAIPVGPNFSPIPNGNNHPFSQSHAYLPIKKVRKLF